MKRKKLINKTFGYFLIFGSLMLAIVTPSYYFYFQRYYIHEVDEYLLAQKENIYQKSVKQLRPGEISEWNMYNDENEILPDNGQKENNRFVTRKILNQEEQDNVLYRILYSKIKIGDETFLLTIRSDMNETKKIILSGTLLHLLFFSGLLLGFGVITQLIYRNLWKPFYQTLSSIERFNIRSNESPAFPPTSIREFHQLNQAVENLIKNNIQAFKIQKEFIENASHELQTPLAVFQSKLDILLQQQELSENQLQIIQSLYEAASRLARMNKNLLLMAKIDNMQFLDTQVVNVSETIKTSLSFLSEHAEMNAIETDICIKDENLTVKANKTLVESMINNLITNAINHNIHGGMISIVLEENRLTITNTGIDRELSSDRLFHRFGRMNEKVKGNGLGLAIVKQICIQYGWDIIYGYKNGTHRFTVVFN